MGNLAPLARLTGSKGHGRLNRRQKAAILVRLMLARGMDVSFKELPDDLQSDITRMLGSMRHIDRDTLNTIVDEFVEEMERLGLTFPRGVAGALTVLDGRISPHTAARLRKEAGVRQVGDPWDSVRRMDVKKLVPIAENESTEVAAVMLSKLDTPKAAELLSLLPGPRARRITYAVSQTTGITPEAMDRIGLSLATQLDAEPASAFDLGPAERVGAILNNSTSATRDDMLVGLDETDRDFAEQVRKAIFTFVNIPTRVAPRDIPKVIRDIDPGTLVTALAAAVEGLDKAAADYILGNMSARLADSLREEMADKGKVKAKDAEEAYSVIVQRIRDMEAAGEILLLAPEEEEE